MSANQFLFKIVKEKPLFIVVSIILSLSGAIFDLIGTALLIPILVVFLPVEAEEIAANTSKIIHLLLTLSDYATAYSTDRLPPENTVLWMSGLLIVAIALKNIIYYFNVLWGNYCTEKSIDPLRLEGFALLCDVGLDFYVSYKVGDIIVRINRELERTAAAIRSGHKILTLAIATLAFSLSLIVIDWQLSLICSCLLAVVAWCKQTLVKRSQILAKVISQKSRDYSLQVIEFLTGIRLIKSVATEAQEYKIVRDLIVAKNQAQLKRQSVLALQQPINEISLILIVAVLLVAGNYLFTRSTPAYSLLFSIYLAILWRLLPIIEQLHRAYTQFTNYSSSGAIVADLLRRDNKPFLASGKLEFTQLQTGINFETVSFAYPRQEKLVLDRIKFTLAKGQTIALVGFHGAGKSTIVDLIGRFYDPTAGRILVDGIDLPEYDLKSFRRGIGIITQDTFLFNNTVAYNLTYGTQNITESALIEAAKQANAYEFISQLPQGFATPIGDRGVILSPGQKQRIAIARAWLRNPELVILDEVTRGLDRLSESLVQEAVRKLCRGRTSLIIAHKLEAIRQADRILVLDRGRIIEAGTHHELLQAGQLYARLYSLQFKHQNQSHNHQLAEKIAQKLMAQSNLRLSYEIRNNLNALMGSLQLVSEGLVEDSQEQEKILDESYQLAKNLLNSLKQYENHLTLEQNEQD